MAEWIIEVKDGKFPIGKWSPLVRCKDCRYGYQFYDVQNGVKDSWIECRNPDGLNRDVPEDGYCYCGKWKDDPSHPFADDVMMGEGEDDGC